MVFNALVIHAVDEQPKGCQLFVEANTKEEAEQKAMSQKENTISVIVREASNQQADLKKLK